MNDFQKSVEENRKHCGKLSKIQLAAAKKIAGMVPNPTADKIVPTPFDAGFEDIVASAVASV